MASPHNRLRSILQTADHLKDTSSTWLAKRGLISDIASEDTSPQPPLELPVPQPIFTQLHAAGVSDILADALSRTYMHTAHELRMSIMEILRKAWFQLAKIPRAQDAPSITDIYSRLHRVHVTLLEQKYAQWRLEKVKTACSNLQQTSPTHQTRAVGRQKKRKRPFNQEYVPLLEHFFGEDPFPSHADKIFLSTKTGMSFKQIHVWFQNRRCRIKKEGAGSGMPYSTAPKIPFETLLERMGERIIPDYQRVELQDTELSDGYNDSIDDHKTPRLYPEIAQVFCHIAPPHAFPAVYPPVCEVEPFPIKNGRHHLPMPDWYRRSTTAHIKPGPPVDIADFCVAFDGLTVRESLPRSQQVRKLEEPLAPQRPKKQKRFAYSTPSLDSSAATVFTTTKPLPAPLPFLVPSVAVTTTLPLPPLLAPVPASDSQKRVFDTPSSCSPSLFKATLDPTRLTRRKVTPLRRRTPPQTRNITARNVFTAVSDISAPSLSRYPVSDWRSSSSNSTLTSARSHRRPSSESSVSSSDIESPVTPPIRAAQLPSSFYLSLSGEPVVVSAIEPYHGDVPLDLLSDVSMVQAGVHKAVCAFAGRKFTPDVTVAV